jgi:pimeloyl-ACP methyl ester carboxylesterase
LLIFARNLQEVHKVMAFLMYKPSYVPRVLLLNIARHQQRNYALNQTIAAQMVEGPWLDDITSTHPVTPTLIVCGDRDRALDVSAAHILHRLLPNSRIIILQGVGHVPMVEAPREAAADYLEFRGSLNRRTKDP